MKKLLAIFLAAIFLNSILATIPASAAPPKQYPILRAATPPTLDGKVEADEWQGAKVGFIDNTVSDLKWGDSDNPIKTDFYLMWDDSGVYFAAVAKDDPSGFVKLADGEEHTKLGDGVQLIIDPSYTVNETEILQVAHNGYIFDIYPDTPWYEHWIYPPEEGGWYDVRAGKGIVTKGWVAGDGKSWSVEAFLPWGDLQKGGEFPMPKFNVAEGMKMSVGYIVMEMGDSQSGICSFDGWETVNLDTGVLSMDLAGIIPAPEPEPEPIPEPEAPAPAPEPEPAPAPAPAPAAPATGDAMVIFALMAAAAFAPAAFGKFKTKNR